MKVHFMYNVAGARVEHILQLFFFLKSRDFYVFFFIEIVRHSLLLPHLTPVRYQTSAASLDVGCWLNTNRNMYKAKCQT